MGPDEVRDTVIVPVRTLAVGSVKKPFFQDMYHVYDLDDVAAVLDARIRPKRKRKLLMAMGFSRNEARKLAFRGGTDWRYRDGEQA